MAQDGSESSGGKASSSSRDYCSAPFRFNVHAPEFVPMSPLASPLAAAGYYSPFLQLSNDDGGGSGTGDWSFFAQPDPAIFLQDFGQTSIDGAAGSNRQPMGASPADIAHKIVKQVEHQFSDTNLVANDFLMKIMNKDPEGYVPMSVISSWKKIKAMGATNQLLVNALRTSAKLVVSEDGKKVRRAQLFTDRHKEELQSRMVVAENLPDDSTRNSLEKIFGIIGIVKNIRICHPQEPSSARSSKSDSSALVSNKLHAVIEYETTQQADSAVDKLNDERNWRKGLRVRTVLRRSVPEAILPKSVIRHKRPDSYEEHSPHSQVVSLGSSTAGRYSEHNQLEQHVGDKKPWGRGRARPPTKLHTVNAGAAGHLESLISSPQGPRMPDGTHGFTMGRGKPSPAMATAVLLRSTSVRAGAAAATVVI
ncbi:hypothetical protein PR202_gb11930 [Eleusine coracana subsp. coracana]|uniref:La-related protein 6C n=1 Tax=Eleusine coracana subsp. coracana TaxID=191504 RepID=A0AAV5ENE1_ELECO|nr:hypothetical protein PR202_gb11930 [Eleusine coracana subsp. coracana]